MEPDGEIVGIYREESVPGEVATSPGEPIAIFKNNGNVGIGTASPGYALELGGSGVVNIGGSAMRFGNVRVMDANGNNIRLNAKAAGSAVQVVNYNLATPLVTFHDGGNVGIGTTTPTVKLEVQGGPIKAAGGLIIETRTSDPPSPATGQIWLRTDL